MSGGKVCIKRFEFTCMSILSPETVPKVPCQCCYSIMDIQVPPVPNQPKTFRFPQRTFGVKKSRSREVFSRRGLTVGRGFIMMKRRGVEIVV